MAPCATPETSPPRTCRSIPLLRRPSVIGGEPGEFPPLFWRVRGVFGLAAFHAAALPKTCGCRIFAPLLWRRLTVFNFSRRSIDGQFGALGRIAGAFLALRFLVSCL